MTHDYLNQAQASQFERDGFLAIRGLISPEEIAEIRATYMAAAADGPVPGLSDVPRSGSANDPLARYPRMMHPHKHADKAVGQLAMRFMLDPRLRPILADLFGEEPFAVQSMFYFKPPGARGQDLHQDNFYLRVKPGTCMAAWIAVDDADAENGGMMCVPQTAMLDIACPEQADPALFFTTEHVEPPEGLEPEMMQLKAGDVLFFNGSVIHGSTPNTSQDRFRRSLIFHYIPGSTKEISHWYEAMSFDGAAREIAVNMDGGPCGTLQEAAMGPH
ncbi:Ectoine hydroxylase-related dioxygenase, phytanoyl-CoA dioxygenase (PhyH) family [Devosia sp. YR412]|uniref:phytanoyl-CoA dioxygenase family protein n=1 Tax=Devosia sp. YR412 TaxID=1881030 RepID=UPI0008C7A0D4|nr:phytanoyl-CoA dioxygenase family protein [Devosia sp. YR412]SEQ05687.1 Ectoine hydroxylase-related dioxygenase, phytanoyl-CoA dioxygenase (PhyH) family [Devosia sp. YR412]